MTDNYLILAVDDDKEELEFIEQALLENKNAHVKTFSDSYSFMRYIKNEDNRLPNLIIIDFNIPKIDGFHLVSFIVRNERYSNIPIVLLTNLISKNEEKD